MPRCGTYTTYEALEELMHAYTNAREPDLRFRAKHTGLWLLAWSASLPRSTLPGVPFAYVSVVDYLGTLSTWRHVQVDADCMLHAVVEAVHGGRTPLPREEWEPMLCAAECLWVSMGAPKATWPLHAPPAPMQCLQPDRLRLALEAPDVRKAALELYYRRERRCHEPCAPGGEAALVQRCRMAHVLAADRHTLLHAALEDMGADTQELLLVAHVHCVLLGQQNLDFAKRGVQFEAELNMCALHASAMPVLARRRRGWSVLWRGSATEPGDVRYALCSWRALILQHGLNPVDGRHDVAAL
jgi:hypothetical protein